MNGFGMKAPQNREKAMEGQSAQKGIALIFQIEIKADSLHSQEVSVNDQPSTDQPYCPSKSICPKKLLIELGLLLFQL